MKMSEKPVASPSAASRAAHIEKLPAELLIKIFQWHISSQVDLYRHHFLAQMDRTSWIAPRSAFNRATVKPYSWIHIRHVCKLWRKIASETSVLSSHIVITRLDCVQDMLERLGDHRPLEIISCSKTDPIQLDTTLQNLITAQFHRVSRATLSLDDRFVRLLANYQPSISTGASPLTTLFLDLGYTSSAGPMASSPLVPPCLEYPNLEDCEFHMGGGLHLFKYAFGCSLRRLVLDGLTIEVVLDDLIVCLIGTPALEELIVVSCLGLKTQTTPHVTATLPALRRLMIQEEEHSYIMPLLHRLVYPVNTMVRLQFLSVYSRGTASSAAQLLNDKLQRTSDSVEIQCASLHIVDHLGRRNWGDGLQLRLWPAFPDSIRAVQFPWNSDEGPKPLLDLELLGIESNPSLVTRLFSNLRPTVCLTKVMFDGVYPFDPTFIRQLASLLPDTKHLILKEVDPTDLPIILYQSETPSFPKLEILDLEQRVSSGLRGFLEGLSLTLPDRSDVDVEELDDWSGLSLNSGLLRFVRLPIVDSEVLLDL